MATGGQSRIVVDRAEDWSLYAGRDALGAYIEAKTTHETPVATHSSRRKSPASTGKYGLSFDQVLARYVTYSETDRPADALLLAVDAAYRQLLDVSE